MTAGKALYWIVPDRFDKKTDRSSWLEVGRHLRERGWNVAILAAKSRSAGVVSRDESVRIVPSLDLPLVFRMSAILSAYVHVVRHSRPGDVVLVNSDALWIVPLVRLLRKRRIHLDIRTLPVEISGLKRRLDQWLFWRLPLRWFGSAVDSCSFITEELKKEVDREFSIRSAHQCIWQSGVNTELFKPFTPQGREVMPFRLFYHGSLSAKRGIDLVIKALALSAWEFPIEFVLLGGGSAKTKLMALAVQQKVEHLVRFADPVPYEQVPEEISQAHVCICPLPDHLEWRVSSPLKVMEYLSCQRPIILSPIAAHIDIAAELPSIVWSRGFSAQEFRSSIEEAYHNYLSLSEATAAGRALVCDRFTWVRQASVLHDCLNAAACASPDFQSCADTRDTTRIANRDRGSRG